MSPYQQEELENVRRVSERGKAYCEARVNDYNQGPPCGDLLDIFTHIIDTVKRIKEAT